MQRMHSLYITSEWRCSRSIPAVACFVQQIIILESIPMDVQIVTLPNSNRMHPLVTNEPGRYNISPHTFFMRWIYQYMASFIFLIRNQVTCDSPYGYKCILTPKPSHVKFPWGLFYSVRLFECFLPLGWNFRRSKNLGGSRRTRRSLLLGQLPVVQILVS
jgi:hypothetical protein